MINIELYYANMGVHYGGSWLLLSSLCRSGMQNYPSGASCPRCCCKSGTLVLKHTPLPCDYVLLIRKGVQYLLHFIYSVAQQVGFISLGWIFLHRNSRWYAVVFTNQNYMFCNFTNLQILFVFLSGRTPIKSLLFLVDIGCVSGCVGWGIVQRR